MKSTKTISLVFAASIAIASSAFAGLPSSSESKGGTRTVTKATLITNYISYNGRTFVWSYESTACNGTTSVYGPHVNEPMPLSQAQQAHGYSGYRTIQFFDCASEQ